MQCEARQLRAGGRTALPGAAWFKATIVRLVGAPVTPKERSRRCSAGPKSVVLRFSDVGLVEAEEEHDACHLRVDGRDVVSQTSQYLREYPYPSPGDAHELKPWDPRLCWRASIQHGWLHALQWIRARHSDTVCLWNGATVEGHDEVGNELVQAKSGELAAMHGQLGVLEWLLAEGCPVAPKSAFRFACKFGNREVAE